MSQLHLYGLFLLHIDIYSCSLMSYNGWFWLEIVGQPVGHHSVVHGGMRVAWLGAFFYERSTEANELVEGCGPAVVHAHHHHTVD
jgi:hypothetical protein